MPVSYRISFRIGVGIGVTVMTTSRRAPRTSCDRPVDDGGFTLVELMVAMAVFGILMVIVGGAMLSGFVGINNVMTKSDAQSSAQIAGEWTGKLLRYISIPEGQTSAITEASPTSITFFTYSGTGPKMDVPYKARIYTVVNANGTKSIATQVWTPKQIAGGWTWATPPMTRTVLTVPRTSTTPLNVVVWARNPLLVPAADPRVVTPAVSGPVVLAAGELPESVVLQIGDQTSPRSLVTQQVRLVNVS